jgi:hypothetical protein
LCPRGQFAPVGSLTHYRFLEEQGVLGDYHLLLAHKVLEDPDGWIDLYRRIREQGREPFVIMDNSLIELGRPLQAPALAEASRIVDASCLVLADVLSNRRATVELSVAMHYELRKMKEVPPFLAVVQGASYEDALLCAEELASLEGVRYLSIPRVVADTMGTRKHLVKEVYRRHQLPIHLLGFSEDMADDIMCTSLPGVMGIDSAVPLRMGLAGVAWGPHRKTPPRPKNFLDSKDVNVLMVENTVEVRKAIGPQEAT